MDNQKKQVAAKLKEARNVLVTVSANPSVDQLSACLGLTLMLNKLGKHASAVFSGEIPSTIEFLKPEDTLETNTNSLRDFIIALDRNKADKLRYKVEDKVVRIFITPYKTPISESDLQFSEGEFNVDVLVALGVKEQADIDQAVVAHGNILHDATVVTITTGDESALGTIHWRDPAASGVSELAASLADEFDKNVLDEQIATAFLTGIVAETERFSNNLTSSNTMTISAKLMSAGANQQLVAEKLEEATPITEPKPPVETVAAAPAPKEESEPGTLQIDHSQPDASDDSKGPAEDSAGPSTGTDSHSRITSGDGAEAPDLTAGGKEEPLDPSTDPFSQPSPGEKLMTHGSRDLGESPTSTSESPEAAGQPKSQPESTSSDSTEEGRAGTAQPAGQTINEIEASVHSPHLHPSEPQPSPEPPAVPDPPKQPESSSQTEPDKASLPGVSIDENGLLIHHNGTDGPNNLRPAPGFESGGSMHHTIEPPSESSDAGPGQAPPVPPPIP